MQIIHTISQLRQYVQTAKQQGQTVGFVPTMGFLHEGHLHLVDTAKANNDVVVVSIFVNPLQFGPTEDFDAYPRDLNRDASLLRSHACDVLFAPSVEEMYPERILTTVEVEGLGQVLCGVSRPTHFKGVTTVVSKLLNIVQPTRAYFGQKDGQQLFIIQRMVRDLNIPVEIIGVPTVRETDGLAKSSRNIYLNQDERKHATILYRTLKWAEDKIQTGERNAHKLIQVMREKIESEPGVKLDYVGIVNTQSLQPVQKIEGHIMIAVAAYVGKARLIDNIQLTV